MGTCTTSTGANRAGTLAALAMAALGAHAAQHGLGFGRLSVTSDGAYPEVLLGVADVDRWFESLEVDHEWIVPAIERAGARFDAWHARGRLPETGHVVQLLHFVPAATAHHLQAVTSC